jgi:ubiquinone/menaquinone biosynthesis C-methylase UbiE
MPYTSNNHYPTFEYLYPALIKLTGVKEGMVLDVGCGFCPLLDLLDRGYEVVCVDKTLNMLKKANMKRGHNLILGDAEKLPFRKDCFETVISNNLLYWLKSIERVVEEMIRVIKPDMPILSTTLDPLLLKKMENAMIQKGLHDVKNNIAYINAESLFKGLSFRYIKGTKLKTKS